MGDTLPKLIQEKIIQSFDNAGFPAAVGAAVEHVTPAYQLVIDLRNFAIATDQGRRQSADVEFSAKLVSDGGKVVATQLFKASARRVERTPPPSPPPSMRPSQKPPPIWSAGSRGRPDRHALRAGRRHVSADPAPAWAASLKNGKTTIHVIQRLIPDESGRHAAAARSSAATSSFTIPCIAAKARADTAGSGSARRRGRTSGTICQGTPQRSPTSRT